MRAVSLFLFAQPVSGQQIVHKSAPLIGQVTNARGEPIGGAAIEVAGTFWRTTSQRDGRFQLAIAPGDWELRIRRLGYLRTTRALAIGTDRTLADTLRVTLAEAASQLQGVVVTGDNDMPFVSTMTTETARQAPPLGEADILRALPMLPSVSQPNDIIGRMHFAGGASDEHSVSLDGHPLQSPYHVHSVLGAFNVAALDRADVLVHHLPSSYDGRLSGAVALETRRASAEASGEAVLSLLSTSVTVSQPSVLGGPDVLMSGRVTYLDRVLRQYAGSSGETSDDVLLPSYRDALLKLARDLKGGWSVEALGYSTLDRWADATQDTASQPLRWGEDLIGVLASRRGAPWNGSFRLSANRAFAGFQRQRGPPLASASPADRTLAQRLDFIDLTQHWISSSLELRRLARDWQAVTGLTFDERRTNQRWDGARAVDLFKSGVPITYDARARQSLIGVYTEGSLRAGPGWSGTAGGHVTLAHGVPYFAPRLTVSANLAATTRVQLAINRRHQFDAIAGEPQEGSITQPVFLLHVPRVADMVALSTTWQPGVGPNGSRVGAEVSLYGRRYRDRFVPDLRASSLGDRSDPASPASELAGMRRVPGSVLGASLAANLSLVNGLVVQGSYTEQRSRERVDGQERPTAWDAPHQLSLFAGIPLGARWTLTSVAQLHSGSAVTPVAARIIVPDGALQYGQRFIYGEPNSARLPAYTRLDLGLRHGWSGLGARWTLSIQALNIFARTNVLGYRWSEYFICQDNPVCRGAEPARRGLPILPSVGLEAKW
ncbi:MAG: TonB-dependent receptor [Gemmatimonadaceae bacterium]|nr:TonB-dependent receptor [Gemmatimonadaceae bacterium]